MTETAVAAFAPAHTFDLVFYTRENCDEALALVKPRPHPGSAGYYWRFDLNSKVYGQEYGCGTLCWGDMPVINGLNAKLLFELANWQQVKPGLLAGTWKDPEHKEYAAAIQKGLELERQHEEKANQEVERVNLVREAKIDAARRDYLVTIAVMAGVSEPEKLPDARLESVAKMAALAGLKIAAWETWLTTADVPEPMQPLGIPEGTPAEREAVARAGMAYCVSHREIPSR